MSTKFNYRVAFPIGSLNELPPSWSSGLPPSLKGFSLDATLTLLNEISLRQRVRANFIKCSYWNGNQINAWNKPDGGFGQHIRRSRLTNLLTCEVRPQCSRFCSDIQRENTVDSVWNSIYSKIKQIYKMKKSNLMEEQNKC